MEKEKILTKKEIVESYFKDLDKIDKYELWEKCKWFKYYWNFNSPDFIWNLTHALMAAGFIENQWWQPISGIIGLATHFNRENEVKKLFNDLFDYQGNGHSTLQTRVENFITGANNLSAIHWKGRTKYYQDVQTTSLYLFLYDPSNNYWYLDNFLYQRCENDFKIDEFYIDFNKFYEFCDELKEEIDLHYDLSTYLEHTHVGFNGSPDDYHILISDILRR